MRVSLWLFSEVIPQIKPLAARFWGDLRLLFRLTMRADTPRVIGFVPLFCRTASHRNRSRCTARANAHHTVKRVLHRDSSSGTKTSSLGLTSSESCKSRCGSYYGQFTKAVRMSVRKSLRPLIRWTCSASISLSDWSSLITWPISERREEFSSDCNCMSIRAGRLCTTIAVRWLAPSAHPATEAVRSYQRQSAHFPDARTDSARCRWRDRRLNDPYQVCRRFAKCFCSGEAINALPCREFMCAVRAAYPEVLVHVPGERLGSDASREIDPLFKSVVSHFRSPAGAAGSVLLVAAPAFALTQ